MSLLDRIRNELLSEAVTALRFAEQYQHSRRQGEKNSVAVFVRRGQTALAVLALIS